MDFDFSKIKESHIFYAICIVCGIWGYMSSSDDETNNGSYGNSYNNSYNNGERMVTCPICNGTGRYNSPDIFKSQMPCTGCSGNKRVPSSQVPNIIRMHTPSTPSSPSRTQNGGRKTRECEHCFGSGVCQTCNGDGIAYGGYGLDPHVCANCLSKNPPGRGKCKWCHGTGRRR